MLRSALRALPVLALFVGAAPPGARAQDAERVLREARAEQARFERVRRSHLPWAWGGGSGECDERIGRFCLTHGRDEDDWVPPPEAPEIVAARDRLLGHLEEAAHRLPTDGWIAGQRVRYLMEAGQPRAAIGAAIVCRAAAWWCSALAGFAYHYAGEPAAADSAFSAALAEMPPEVRDQWTDLSPLLEGRSQRAYRRLAGAERERFAERYWRLGDPLYSRPGNELRSEHLSRNVWDFLQDRARSAENLAWGSDLREILLRYGWPAGWERVRERPGSLSPPSLVSHYSNAARNLAPPPEPLLDGELAGGEWDAETDRPRTGYGLPLADSLARWIDSLDHQFAVFRRGDSVLVAAAYALPADSLPAGARVDAALALARGDGEAPLVSRFPAGAGRGATHLVAPPGPLLLSLEVLSEDARRAARARRGVRAPPLEPGLIAVSDLLLLRSADALPDSLPPALLEARESTRVRPGERMGVYWEVYGLPRERPSALTMSLRLLDPGGGWLRRLAEQAGLRSREEPVRLSWQEQAIPAPYLGRSLAIQIPEVKPGEYLLELSVTLPGREPVRTTRALQVR